MAGAPANIPSLSNTFTFGAHVKQTLTCEVCKNLLGNFKTLKSRPRSPVTASEGYIFKAVLHEGDRKMCVCVSTDSQMGSSMHKRMVL